MENIKSTKSSSDKVYKGQAVWMGQCFMWNKKVNPLVIASHLTMSQEVIYSMRPHHISVALCTKQENNTMRFTRSEPLTKLLDKQ